MNHDEKKLKKMLQEMELGHEVKKERRKAAKLRRAFTPPAEHPRFAAREILRTDPDVLDALDPLPAVRRGSSAARSPAGASARERRQQAAPEGRVGTVSGVFPGLCRVRLEGEERECRLAPTVAVEQRAALAIGDLVRIGERGGVLRVEQVLPRRSALTRSDPTQPQRERVLAANVDLVVIATALRAPGVKPGLIDRVLVAAHAAGCAAIVCVNKVDLAATDDDAGRAAAAELALLEPYAARGVEVLTCSAESGAGIARLRARLQGQTAVLVGQSGCGKSSLTNVLVPALALPTGPSRAGDGKGRHTTTASSLHPLPGGGFLIDTPGVRQFGLAEPGEEALDAAFPELVTLASGCRFRDCRHECEPGCAVRVAVDSGALASARLESFRRLRRGGAAGG